MSDSVKPPGGSSHTPSPDASSSKKPASFSSHHGSAGMTMSKLMEMMTPEEKKKFEMCLTQNLSNQIKKSSDRYIEELRKERSGDA